MKQDNMTNTTLEAEAGAKRAAIERALARYPDLQPDEIETVTRYLRKEASALDRASIASNAELQEKYRQFCHDQHFDRLRPFEIALVVAGVLAVIVIVIVTYQIKA